MFLVCQEVKGSSITRRSSITRGSSISIRGSSTRVSSSSRGSPISMRISSSRRFSIRVSSLVRGSPTLVRISSFIRGSPTSMWPPRTIIITAILSVFSTSGSGSSLYICVSLRGFSLCWPRNFLYSSSNRVSHWKRPRSIQVWHD